MNKHYQILQEQKLDDTAGQRDIVNNTRLKCRFDIKTKGRIKYSVLWWVMHIKSGSSDIARHCNEKHHGLSKKNDDTINQKCCQCNYEKLRQVLQRFVWLENKNKRNVCIYITQKQTDVHGYWLGSK